MERMRTRVLHFDVFASQPGKGNPAGIVLLPHHLDTNAMQAVAASMHARHFSAPSSGAVEDPVTGTASGVLGAYYQEFVAKERCVSQPLVVEQGYEVGREGRVRVWVDRDKDGYLVRIGGSAVFAGELLC
jgi:predicted PhzF superfamily epimerase YddE/YHI9